MMQCEVITLEAAPEEGGPRFLSAQLLPHRAMMLYQVRALLPGEREVEVLAAPALEEGLAQLAYGSDDFPGNASFAMGGAFLAPFVNRIRGQYDPARREIQTEVGGLPIALPANGGGKAPGAEQYAIHGLILDRAVSGVELVDEPRGQAARAHLAAGDFEGRWVSSTDLDFQVSISPSALSAAVRATNSGGHPLPLGLGWHPYFNLPSGNRQQARIHVPARARLPVNNYDEVLPTGKVETLVGTDFDFSVSGGRPLADTYLDDCFVYLEKNSAGEAVFEVVDPAAGYGLRIISSSSEVSAVQTFAPPDRPFVVIEPQFSWANPFGSEWEEGVDTGMVTLQPGQSVDYKVRLELFTP
jgi:aldose 1-epimerase